MRQLESLNLPTQARSQPARWGGLNLDGWNTRRTPPLGLCPRDVINLKNAPTLGHSQAPPPPWTLSAWRHQFEKRPHYWTFTSTPPLGHCPCDVIHIFQGWNKIAEGWNKIAEGWNKIAKGWNKIAERWNKIAKGWNKIAKGWNKIFGMGNWGGSYDPPDPPLATGLPLLTYLCRCHIEIWPNGKLTRGPLFYIENWHMGHFSI